MTLLESIRTYVRALTEPRMDAMMVYRFRVVMQHDDGMLDIAPTPIVPTAADQKPKAPAMTRVPIAYGEPGIRARVKPGAVVFVQFIEGDLGSPYVVGWAAGSVDELTIDAQRVRLGDGDRPMAREGDAIVAIASIPALASSVLAPSPSGSIAITGYVLRGSQRVRGS